MFFNLKLNLILNPFLTPRRPFIWLLLICLLVFTSLLFIQLNLNIQPCPLCIMQRIGLFGIGLMSLLGCLFGHKKIGGYICWILLLISTLFGWIMAAKQVYLQYYPGAISQGCGPGIGYLFKNLPFHQAFLLIFQGSGACEKIHLHILGISIACWSLVWFSLVLIYGVFGLMRICHRRH